MNRETYDRLMSEIKEIVTPFIGMPIQGQGQGMGMPDLNTVIERELNASIITKYFPGQGLRFKITGQRRLEASICNADGMAITALDKLELTGYYRYEIDPSHDTTPE